MSGIYWTIYYYFNPPKTKGEAIAKFCKIHNLEMADFLMDHVEPSEFFGIAKLNTKDL